jgi:demethylmenaquinone methyltransferase/2-methoxy-6-polyprenyl-1,4-benzoquinol methylase
LGPTSSIPCCCARTKAARAKRILLAEADALTLPFPDGSFDVVTAAFGFRNLANYRRGLEEIRRVLKRGGEVGILESLCPSAVSSRSSTASTSTASCPGSAACSPAPRAYNYLPASVEKFPDCPEFARWMEAAGFKNVRYRLWTGGTVVLYLGKV